MAVVLARIRVPLQFLGFALIVVGVVIVAARGLVPGLGGLGSILIFAGVACVAGAFGATVLAPAVGGEALAVASPVRGRWEAVNSPSSKIPSHGTHAYGQTYAVDLVFAPDGGTRPEFGTAGGAFLPPERFPAFGQSLYAPASGTVVRAVDDIRDHRSRSSYGAFAWFFFESIPRDLRGVRGVLGNHLVLRLEDGSHFVFAHLKRSSLRVAIGDTVSTGDLVAECGNTGNSTEPHLHCQRQDVANTLIAIGLPWTIEPGGVPANGDALG